MNPSDTIVEVAIETLSLDAGGVLTFPNWERISDTFARHGIRVSAAALQQADPHARFAIDRPQHIAKNDADRGSLYFRLMFERAGIPPDAPIQPALDELWAYHTEHNLWEYVPPYVVPTLERLAAAGVTLAIGSNANGALHRLFDRLGLSKYFTVICDSCVEGVEKPDPRFFDIVVQRAGGKAETTLHVGDLYYVDVEGARRAGLRAALFDPLDLYSDFDVDRIRDLGQLSRTIERTTNY